MVTENMHNYTEIKIKTSLFYSSYCLKTNSYKYYVCKEQNTKVVTQGTSQ